MQTMPALIISSMIGGILGGSLWGAVWSSPSGDQPAVASAPAIGELFLTTYLLPFEIASVLLLVALVGAALMARRERKA